MAKLLVDTDVFVDHLRGARRLTPASHAIHYSVVTRCELFAGEHVDEHVVRVLLEPFVELALDRATAELAGQLRRAHGVRVADALIGATALQHRLALVTRNTRDFVAIQPLKLRDAAEIQDVKAARSR